MTPERSVSSVLEQSSLFCARRWYSPHFLPSVVVTRVQPPRSELRKGAKSAVPLADRAIGNLQQWLVGTYHGVSRSPSGLSGRICLSAQSPQASGCRIPNSARPDLTANQRSISAYEGQKT